MTLLKKRLMEAPRMEPTDAVKFLYQRAFGCGHLLADAEAVESRIRRELDEVNPDPAQPAATFLGGGLCRLHLANPQVHALPPKRLAAMMISTAEAVGAGDMARFERGLLELTALAQAGELPFSSDALTAYLADYRAQGYPPVSHSAGYRAAYHPAYRVVLEDHATLVPVLAEMEARLAHNGRVIVAIDGDCGAGKTTLTAALAALYQAKPLHLDDFFLPFALRTEERLREAGGNVHYERFASEVLGGLQTGADFSYQRYDCATGTLLPRSHQASAVTLIEGSYSHHPYFDAAYQSLSVLRVFLAVSQSEQLRRLRLRDPAKLDRFQKEWIPLEKSYQEGYDIKRRADIALQSHPWEDDT